MSQGLAKGELAGVRVLIVDDQDDIRETLGEFFAMCGMEVRTAASGNQAFAAFERDRPEIVVSDIGMPDGSGIDLVRRIRALPEEAGGLTPTIAVSGEASAADCFEAGYHFHFVKPVEPLALLDTIRDFVRNDERGRASWSVSELDGDAVVRFVGHVCAPDMRAAVSNLSELIARSTDGCRVIVDLRNLSGFDPSVGVVAQTGAWRVRTKITGAVIVGGSRMAQLVARSSCLILGVSCELADSVPEPSGRQLTH